MRVRPVRLSTSAPLRTAVHLALSALLLLAVVQTAANAPALPLAEAGETVEIHEKLVPTDLRLPSPASRPMPLRAHPVELAAAQHHVEGPPTPPPEPAG